MNHKTNMEVKQGQTFKLSWRGSDKEKIVS